MRTAKTSLPVELKGTALIVSLLSSRFVVESGLRKLDFPFVDLPSFYLAARAVFTHSASPYDPTFLSSLTNEGAGGHVFPFFYPPTSLPFLLPLAAVSYRTAALTVLFGNIVATFSVAFLLCRFLLAGAPLRSRAAVPVIGSVLLCTASRPVDVTILSGQVNLFILALLLLHFGAVRSGVRPALAALPLAAATAVKTYPILLLLYLVGSGRRREAAWTVGWLGAAAAATFFVVPAAAWTDWRDRVAPFGGYLTTPPGLFSPSSPYNQSLNGFFSRLEVVVPPRPVRAAAAYAAALFVIAVSYAAALLGPRPSEKGGLVPFSIFLLAVLLVAPLTWEHHMVFALPAAAVAVSGGVSGDGGDGGDRPGRRIFPSSAVAFSAVALPAVVLLALEVPFDDPRLQGHRLLGLFVSVKPAAVLALWAWLVLRVLGRGGALQRGTGPVPSLPPGRPDRPVVDLRPDSQPERSEMSLSSPATSR